MADGEGPAAPIRGLRERFPELIRDFRSIASALLRKMPAPSLLSDDLVNEAFLKLLREEQRRLQAKRSDLGSKSDIELKACFGIACRDVMSVRWHKRRRRHEVGVSAEEQRDARRDFDLAEIHEMLSTLATIKPDIAEIVEARIFWDLTVRECSELFAVSPATVDRRWAVGRAWIRRQLTDRPEP